MAMTGAEVMDAFWERVFWFLIVGSCAAIGWIAKSILKPWSDAALMRSKAFYEMVEVLQRSVPAIHTELTILKHASAQSNSALQANSEAADRQTDAIERHMETAAEQTAAIQAQLDWWKKIGSDPMKMCRADEMKAIVEAKAIELGITPDRVLEIIELLKELKMQGKSAAAEIERKDKKAHHGSA